MSITQEQRIMEALMDEGYALSKFKNGSFCAEEPGCTPVVEPSLLNLFIRIFGEDIHRAKNKADHLEESANTAQDRFEEGREKLEKLEEAYEKVTDEPFLFSK